MQVYKAMVNDGTVPDDCNNFYSSSNKVAHKVW